MTYEEAIAALYARRWLGMKLGLRNVRRLAALVGNPHQDLRFVHVAGTTGKGSTCAMLEAIYRAQGYRVGLFLSPHLVSFRERMQVNRRPIGKADVVRLAEELERRIASANDPGFAPTFFEMATVMALLWFREQGCELVMWETGMGGRLDATNLVRPSAAVITNVQFDHQQWLGDSLEAIAAEKAGIIKPGAPAVTGVEEPGPLDVIWRRAFEAGAPLRTVGPEDLEAPPIREARLPLPGAHQRRNAALALAVAEVLQPQFPVSSFALRKGLESVRLSGRCQMVRDAEGRLTALDGAHNPAGARALAATLRELFPGRRYVLVAGALQDKDWPGMWEAFAEGAEAAWLAPVASSRSADPGRLAAHARLTRPGLPVRTAGDLREALAKTARAPMRVITGSLYLVGEALGLLGLESGEGNPGGDWAAVSAPGTSSGEPAGGGAAL